MRFCLGVQNARSTFWNHVEQWQYVWWWVYTARWSGNHGVMIEWMEGELIFWDWKDIKKKPIHGFKSSHWNIFDCWVYMLGFLNELILSRHLLFGGEECEYAYVWPVLTRQIPISFTVLFLTVWPFSDTTDTNQLYSTVVIATYQTYYVGFVFGGQGLVTPVYSGRLVVKMTWAFSFRFFFLISGFGALSPHRILGLLVVIEV